MDADVIVVGAGLAGLVAADRLAASGRDVLVVEARDRVGGRTWTLDVGGARLDVGAQWLGPTQHRMLGLVERFGMATFPTHTDGRNVIHLRGRRRTYRGTIPRMHPIALLQAQWLLSRIERDVGAVDAGRPWAAPRAEQLDATTVAEWLGARRAHPDLQGSMAAGLRVVFGHELHEVSMLQLLDYAAAAGGIMPLLDTRGGAQDRRLVDGTQAFSVRLAEGLPRSVALGEPVQAIEHYEASVAVVTARRRLTARHVVVAVPSSLATRIAFTPALPDVMRQRLDEAPMGTTTKYLVTYRQPYWRHEGLSGEAVATSGPLSVVFDNTSHDGAVPGLVAFAVAQPARDLARLGEDERRASVVDHLVQLFGAWAAEPVGVVEQQWADEEWTGGCPVAIPSPGITMATSTDWAPLGRLHWAGTETADEWRGYLEGAAQSGERAAAEVLAAGTD